MEENEHNEIIKEIYKLNKYLIDKDIYMGGKGFYRVLNEKPHPNKKNLFFCESIKNNKKYIIEFANEDLTHVELQKYLRRVLFLLVLEHEKGVISAIDFSIDSSCSFVILDWIPGPGLHVILKRFQQLSLKEVCWITLDIPMALNHLESFGFVHRNIQAKNIILKENFAKAYLGGVEHINQSDFCETVIDIDIPYASPELIDSIINPEKNTYLTPYSDVYSLGGIFYHLLTGQKPPSCKRQSSLFYSVPKIERGKLPRKQRNFCQYLIKKTMAYDWRKRWRADEVYNYVKEFLNQSDRFKDMARLHKTNE